MELSTDMSSYGYICVSEVWLAVVFEKPTSGTADTIKHGTKAQQVVRRNDARRISGIAEK